MGRVFLTGGSGFVGTQVLQELLRQGYQVQMLAHRAPAPGAVDGRVSIVRGSILDPASLAPAMQGCAAAIHLVGIIDQRQATFHDIHTRGTQNVVDACHQAGIRRYIHMSAQGTRADAVSAYHQSKWLAEQYVRSSGLAYTIFRPSIIYGPGGELTNLLRAWSLGQAPPFLFMPFFGRGFFGQSNPHRLSPVHVEDVACAFVAALATDAAIGQTYSVGGPAAFTWKELLACASREFRGRPKLALGIPAWLARTLAALHLPGLPFNRDQVIMALEDNTADTTDLHRDFPALQFRAFPADMVAR